MNLISAYERFAKQCNVISEIERKLWTIFSLGTNPFDMEASVTDPEGSTELCEIMDEEDFHYRMMFTPQMEGTHTLSIKHKGLHISGTVSRFLFYLGFFYPKGVLFVV